MSAFVISYDISNDSSREHVADILLAYGRRVQRSVYEVEVDYRQLPSLLSDIGKWLSSTDALDVFPMDTRRLEQRISWFREPYPEETVFVIGIDQVVQ